METPEEIEGKSLVHWQTWREAYDDLLPAEFQETMTLERCRFFSQKYPENTLIAILKINKQSPDTLKAD